MTSYIAFRAEEALHVALKAKATENGVSVSRVIRGLLSRGIGRDGNGVEGRKAG